MILKPRFTKPNNTTEIKWCAFVKNGKKFLDKMLKTYLYEFKIGRRLKYCCQITQKPVENLNSFYRQIVFCKCHLKFKHTLFIKFRGQLKSIILCLVRSHINLYSLSKDKLYLHIQHGFCGVSLKIILDWLFSK